MKVPHWLRGRRKNNSLFSAPGARPRRYRSLGFESLEERRVLSVVVNPLVVTTTSDAVSHSGVSLRDAINTADTDSLSGISDTITFDSSLNGQTIVLQQGDLELGSDGTGTITINGANQITISGNKSSDVFYEYFSSAILEGLTITDGSSEYGGAIYVDGGTLNVSNSTIAYNTGTYGGGIYAYYSTLNFTNTSINNNYSSSEGGAFYDENEVVLSFTNSTISNNYGYEGAGFYNYAYVTMSVNNSTISGNTAYYDGGGIFDYYAAYLTMNNSVLSNNSGGLGEGGGILNYYYAYATIENSAITGNTSEYGGGISNSDDSVMTVVNTTISGNAASGGSTTYGGGGVYNDNSSSITLTNSTISNNSAAYDYGGGIFNAATVTLVNTIVAGNTIADDPIGSADVYGAVVSSSNNNLIGDGSSLTGISNNDANGNQVGTSGSPINAMLDPLANYGGTTTTMALQSGSPAINAGGAVTTLATTINSTDTAFTTSIVTNYAAIASTPGTYLIQIDSEQIQIVVDSSGNITATRHANGTTAASHNAGAAITLPYDQIGDARVNTADIGAYEYHGATALISTFGGTVNYTAGGAPVTLASAATVTDTSSLASSKLVVSIGNAGTYDVATIVAGNGVTINNSALTYGGNIVGYFTAGSGSTPLVVQFTSKATTAAVQAVMNDVVFSNTSASAWIYDRTATFQLTDQNNVAGESVTKTVHFVAAPPVVSNLGPTTNYTPGSGATVVASGATVSGANNLENSKLVVSIANAGTTDMLVISAGNGITLASSSTAGIYQVLYNGVIVGWYQQGSGSTPLVVQFNTAATAAAVQAVADDIAYYNTNSAMSVYDRTVSFALTDGLGNTSTVATKTIHVGLPVV
ncbi:MAG TPA: choice-of-anchor Q domain-containing protein [Pirellulales bacterium]|jgi:hypothetical protein|nr:choice-of-anchor Q domain-containing protein [Pirellulales bacterium]